jgi:hypothetical protein
VTKFRQFIVIANAVKQSQTPASMMPGFVFTGVAKLAVRFSVIVMRSKLRYSGINYKMALTTGFAKNTIFDLF